MGAHSLNELGTKSGVYEILEALTPDQCSHMIDLFETHPDLQQPGITGNGVDPDVKQSTDLYIKPISFWQSIDTLLFDSLALALGELQLVNDFFMQHQMVDEGYQIQRTDPGQYYHWHCDDLPPKHRTMVAIWYLNDLQHDQGGRTQFKQQDLSIRPAAGTLLLFPPYHTHTHRGETLNYGQKWIATTWLQIP
jgi:hypothetical protein